MIRFDLTFFETEDSISIRAACDEVGETRYPYPQVPVAALPDLTPASASRAALVEAGRELFDLFFTEANHSLFLRAREQATAHGKALGVAIQSTPESRVAALPWEFLHDGNLFLFEDPRISIVRYFEEPIAVRDLLVDPPVRILFTSASPEDHPKLDVEAEELAVRSAYEGVEDRVEIEPHHGVSLEDLDDLLRTSRTQEKPFHIWHHYGHGGLLNGAEGTEFRLYIENEESPYSDVEQVGRILRSHPDLRLAVLASCFSGTPVGIAPHLARLSLPAVIGFAGRIIDKAERRFSHVLHQCLPTLPIEQAFGEARRSLLVRGNDSDDWKMPLLFSRRRDRGALWPKAAIKAVEAARQEAPETARPWPRRHTKSGLNRRDRRLQSVVAELDRRLAGRT